MNVTVDYADGQTVTARVTPAAKLRWEADNGRNIDDALTDRDRAALYEVVWRSLRQRQGEEREFDAWVDAVDELTVDIDPAFYFTRVLADSTAEQIDMVVDLLAAMAVARRAGEADPEPETPTGGETDQSTSVSPEPSSGQVSDSATSMTSETETPT